MLPARQRICADLVGRPPNLGQRPPLRHSSALYLLSHERLEARTDVRYREAADDRWAGDRLRGQVARPGRQGVGRWRMAGRVPSHGALATVKLYDVWPITETFRKQVHG